MSWLVVIGLFAVLVWVYLIFGRGMFWRVDERLVSQTLAPESSTRVAVVIPARNEADVVGQSVTSLLNQSGSRASHLFLIDDGSTDGTAQVARDAALSIGKADQLTVISGRPLPPGWTGKLWALEQGITRALALNLTFILLTDADILHGPDSISSLVSIASKGYDLVSFMVKLRCRTVAEKLLIPAFVFFFFKLYPPAWIADPRRSTAGAAGGCILVRPEALARAGGITAIRDQIIDDCALAGAVKRSGGKLWLGLTASTCSLRSYHSFAAIGRMVARTAFKQLHHSTLMLVAAVTALLVTYAVPIALLFSRDMLPIALGAVAWVLMTVAYLPMVGFYRLNKLWALTLPMAALFYLGATMQSALNFWLGSGGQWKGREQDVKRWRAGPAPPSHK